MKASLGLTLVFAMVSVSALLAQEAELPPVDQVTIEDVAEPMPIPEPAVAGPPGQFWIGVEYLCWFSRPGPVPPLVTSGVPSAPGAGSIGAPGTFVAYGSRGLDYYDESGGRFSLGAWFTPDRRIGAEISGLILETHTIHFKIDSDSTGAPLVARPYFNVLTGAEAAQIVTAPGKALGGIDVFSDSRFWGAEANGLTTLAQGPRGSVVGIVGFRYLGLDESFRISQASVLLAPGPGFVGVPVPPPNIVSVTDRFETRNQFYGAQVGARGQLFLGRFSGDVVGKLALGATQQSVTVSGGTSNTGPDGIIHTVPGGLYALPTNLGYARHSEFSFATETGFGIGYRIRPRITLRAGYTFIYWSDVARAGDQVNRNLNPRQVPSFLRSPPQPPQPVRLFSETASAQGLDVGLTRSFKRVLRRLRFAVCAKVSPLPGSRRGRRRDLVIVVAQRRQRLANLPIGNLEE